MAKEKSCGAVLYKRDRDSIKYLLLHYGAGHWDLPKGHMEKNEKEEETAAREIREETGIELDNLEFKDGFHEVVNYYFKKEEDTVFKEVVYFIAQSATDKIELSNEHIGYAWLSFDHAHNKLTYNTTKDLLAKANKFISHS